MIVLSFCAGAKVRQEGEIYAETICDRRPWSRGSRSLREWVYGSGTGKGACEKDQGSRRRESDPGGSLPGLL